MDEFWEGRDNTERKFLDETYTLLFVLLGTKPRLVFHFLVLIKSGYSFITPRGRTI